LSDDFYYLEEASHTLIGRRSGRRFRLGDRMEVVVARVDVDRRELDLIPSDHPEASLPPSRTKARGPRAPIIRPLPPPPAEERPRSTKVRGKAGRASGRATEKEGKEKGKKGKKGRRGRS
jgi:ribonuclease R